MLPNITRTWASRWRQKWRLDDAVAAYRHAIGLKFNYPGSPYNNLGNAADLPGESFEEAIAAYETAIRLKPAYCEALCNLANALKEQGKLDEAVAACSRVIELTPASAAAHGNLANVLKDQGLIEEAVRSLVRSEFHLPEPQRRQPSQQSALPAALPSRLQRRLYSILSIVNGTSATCRATEAVRGEQGHGA